jgi:(p)ppGpp synthase/HD superfamily hydrolase
MTTESASAFGVADAVRIAREAHEGQVDKAGRPYIGHVLRVMKRLDTDEEQMAAALHDVIEDTDATPDSLLALGVPKVVVEAVQSLTKREGETYADFVDRAGSHPIARRVKLADLADNADPRRVAALRDKNEALAAELRQVAAQFLADADELEAKPDRLLDKYTKAIEALGGTEEVAKWWAETP